MLLTAKKSVQGTHSFPEVILHVLVLCLLETGLASGILPCKKKYLQKTLLTLQMSGLTNATALTTAPLCCLDEFEFCAARKIGGSGYCCWPP